MTICWRMSGNNISSSRKIRLSTATTGVTATATTMAADTAGIQITTTTISSSIIGSRHRLQRLRLLLPPLRRRLSLTVLPEVNKTTVRSVPHITARRIHTLPMVDTRIMLHITSTISRCNNSNSSSKPHLLQRPLRMMHHRRLLDPALLRLLPVGATVL